MRFREVCQIKKFIRNKQVLKFFFQKIKILKQEKLKRATKSPKSSEFKRHLIINVTASLKLKLLGWQLSN